MSVLLLAIGTTRARAVRDSAAYLLERGVEVALVTAEPEPWPETGLDPRVRIHALRPGEDRHPLARLGRGVRKVSKAAYTKVYSKVYRLLRPYVLWRVARRDVVRGIDWAAVEQLVICDSHAIPLGWHLAKRHPRLPVGFELDRAPYADREPVAAAAVDAAADADASAAALVTSPPEPAGSDIDA